MPESASKKAVREAVLGFIAENQPKTSIQIPDTMSEYQWRLLQFVDTPAQLDAFPATAAQHTYQDEFLDHYKNYQAVVSAYDKQSILALQSMALSE